MIYFLLVVSGFACLHYLILIPGSKQVPTIFWPFCDCFFEKKEDKKDSLEPAIGTSHFWLIIAFAC
jgi:hypothetical protein